MLLLLVRIFHKFEDERSIFLVQTISALLAYGGQRARSSDLFGTGSTAPLAITKRLIKGLKVCFYTLLIDLLSVHCSNCVSLIVTHCSMASDYFSIFILRIVIGKGFSLYAGSG